MVGHPDSVEKIRNYLRNAGQKLTLSKLFFRDYSCPKKCGGCCLKFSLDFFEGKRWEDFKSLYPEHVARFQKREVEGVTVWTDWQADNETRWCRHLDMTDGRCRVHNSNPFSCEFELIKFMEKGERRTLIKKLFGRGWQFQRVDGGRGAKCEMLPFDGKKIDRDIELLEELDDYGTRFKIKTKLKRVIQFLKRNLDQLRAGRVPKKEMRFFD